MKKNKMILATASVLLLSFLLPGCTKNAAQGKAWREYAKEKAVDFVCDKYDFDEDDIEIKSVKSWSEGTDVISFTTYDYPLTWVKMEYDGVEFTVELDASTKDNDWTKDDYQKEEIIEALKSVVEDESDLDIEKIEISYADYAYQYPGFQVHNKYEVSKKASTEEKIEALHTVFDYDYGEVLGAQNQTYHTVSIYISVIGEDKDVVENDCKRLGQLLNFVEMNVYELSFTNKSVMKEAGDDIFETYNADRLAYSFALDAIASYVKSEKYLNFDAVEYIHCEIEGFDCVVVGCSPDDVEISSKKNDDEITEKFGKTYETASKMYEVSFPEDAKVVIFVDQDDFDEEVGVAIIYNEKYDNQTIKDRTSVKYTEFAILAGDRYYVEPEDGEQFCFVIAKHRK